MKYQRRRMINVLFYSNVPLKTSDETITDATTASPSTTLNSSNNIQPYDINERRSKYKAIIKNYNITDMFQPVPWLQNNHLQTIGGFLFRKLTQDRPNHNRHNFAYIPQNEPWYQTILRMMEAFRVASMNHNENLVLDTTPPPPPPPFWDRRERIRTPDGDFFHVDIKHSQPQLHDEIIDPNNNNNNSVLGETNIASTKSIVILLHGLQSNSQSPVCMEMASAILHHSQKNDCECHCINFRGCSGIPNDTVGGYHLGYTDDVKYYLEQLYQQYNSRNIPFPPIYITGFSLGANVALKCIGELGSRAQEVPYNIHGASVLCLPLDQVANAPVLAQPGINRLIYTQNLLQSLQKKCTEQYEQFYGTTDAGGMVSESTVTPIYNYTKVMSARTITEFDDSFIAPIYNFTDCWDYYTQTSSIHYLHNITVPTLVINAQDDPFFDNSIWPTYHSVEHGGTVPIKMIQTKHGGHLGYYFHQIECVSDERLVATAHLTREDGAKEAKLRIIPSWSAWETGKFVNHVHDALFHLG